MIGLPPVGADVRVWAQDFRRVIAAAWDRLGYKTDAANAVENGVILWDNASGYPVVSKGGAFAKVGLFVGVPASATASGQLGEFAQDAAYIYVCTATDTWKRAGIATW
jgi:hypothetical protein